MAKYNEGRLEMQGKSILIEEITVGMVGDDRGAYSFFWRTGRNACATLNF